MITNSIFCNFLITRTLLNSKILIQINENTYGNIFSDYNSRKHSNFRY